jgi:hypothetical protein
MADAFDVDAATDDVGGDQNGNLAAAKSAHYSIARGLGKITMNGRNTLDHPAQTVRKPVGPPLGAGEDDALPWSVTLEQKKQQVEFPVGIDGNIELLDRVDRWLILGKIDLERLEHVTLREFSHIGVDRGRQQKRLARRGQLAKDPFDIRAEANVEHPIGLIEYDVHDIAEIQRSSLDMVEHTARRADHNVDTARQGADLTLDGLTAECPANDDVAAESQPLQLARNLLSQLAGGRQDDRLRPSSPGFEHLNDRNSKGSRFAGAGFGLSDDIESIERLGNECSLNGAGCNVADLLQGAEHRRAQPHGLEPHGGFLKNSSNQSTLQKLFVNESLTTS